MSLTVSHARGFLGARLEGSPVRIAYLDEAGISNRDHEPYLVVAGVIMHADTHWRPLEEHFRAIAARYLPNDPKPIFHAKDIFHGTGKFDRKLWSRERRWHLLSEICEIPKKFDLPIVAGFTQRERYEEQVRKLYPETKPSLLQTMTHAETFIQSALAIEGWMARFTQREAVMMIAEDAPKMKKALKIMHSGYTDRFAKLGDGAKVFHSNHIIETVHFAEKRESMPLQIADACAFVFKRHLMGRLDAIGFYNVMRSQLYWHEHERGLLTLQAS